MLSAPEFPLFRPQNTLADTIEEPLPQENCDFLPANYYPIQTPGFTVHWSASDVIVLERNDELARTLIHIKAADFSNNSHVFDKRERGEGRSHKTNSSSSTGLFGWLKAAFKLSSNTQVDQTKFISVLPLMFDSTVFDVLIAIQRGSDGCVGFIRLRQLMNGADFRDFQRFDGFIPAIDCKSCVSVWKSYLFIPSKSGKFFWIDLSKFDEASWMDTGVSVPESFDKFIICSGKTDEKASILVVEKDNKISGYFSIEKDSSVTFNDFEYKTCDLIGGFIEEGSDEKDSLILIDRKKVIKIDSGLIISSENLCIDCNESDLIHLVPWRRDLKVSSLLVQLKSKAHLYQIVVLAVIGLKSEILLESDWFTMGAKGKIKKIFVSSCLEIFLLDSAGNVEIFEGLLLASDWNWLREEMRGFASKSFEFSQWFNILGDFPFVSDAKRHDDDGLVIDEVLFKECGIEGPSFPPQDWKSLGALCEKLKESQKIELVIYLLMASRAHPAKLAQFYAQYGITDRQVAFIESVYLIDKREFESAIKVFCTRKLREEDKKLLAMKLMILCGNEEELARFSLFSAGRLISLDVLLLDSNNNDNNTGFNNDNNRHHYNSYNSTNSWLLSRMIEVILGSRGVDVVMEWLKGLFAWLRPDDRCALIPVAVLHRQLMGQFLSQLLALKTSEQFKHFGTQLAAYSTGLDVEMLKILIAQLRSEIISSANEGRAAWLLTMICASREILYPILLEFDFSDLRDRELLAGIERIRDIIRPLAAQCETIDLRLIDTEMVPSDNCNNYNSSSSVAILSPRNSQSKPGVNLNNASFNRKDLIRVYEKSPKASQISLNNQSSLSLLSSPLLLSTSTNAMVMNSNHPPLSPSFNPRHFPPKKPTSLSSTIVDRSHQKRSRFDEIETTNEIMPSVSSNSLIPPPPPQLSINGFNEDLAKIMFTKEDGRVFESVINGEKNAKRRRRK